MCTHAWRRVRYAEGAGKVSMLLVEKVRWLLLKGSMRSGLDGDVAGFSGWSLLKKGPLESRRMAWVMVGWKRPPNCEWAERCVGRTWPKVKKVERPLRCVRVVVESRRGRFL
jgi:hypothetical protein